MVYCTVAPGVVDPVLAVLVIVRPCTVTVAVERGWGRPAKQLAPAGADVIVLARILLPASGLFTVTEKVMVAVAPAASVPVQVRFGAAEETLPTGAGGAAVEGGVGG